MTLEHDDGCVGNDPDYCMACWRKEQTQIQTAAEITWKAFFVEGKMYWRFMKAEPFDLTAGDEVLLFCGWEERGEWDSLRMLFLTTSGKMKDWIALTHHDPKDCWKEVTEETWSDKEAEEG